MVSKRSALFGLLMVLINTATVYSQGDDSSSDLPSGITPKQAKILNDIQSPECMQQCDQEKDTQNQDDYYTPLCASSGETETSESQKEGYQCLCTDKRYVELVVSCYVEKCGSNSTALDIALTGQYGLCYLSGNVTYPKPETFLNDLCLLDDLPKNSVPTDLALLKAVWPDYTYAQDFPTELEHTTVSGTSTPTWTCTPTSGSADATPTTTSGDNSTDTAPTNTLHNGTNSTIKHDSTGEAEGRRALMGTAAVLAAVAGIAVFL